MKRHFKIVFMVLIMSQTPHAWGILDKNEFEHVIKQFKEVNKIYMDVKELKLVIDDRWSDDVPNAHTMRRGKKVILTIYGGLARTPHMSKAALAGVLCHELGHTLGGTPIYSTIQMSNEGQSDYYATSKCLKRYLKREMAFESYEIKTVPGIVKKNCEKVFSHPQDQMLCTQASQAGIELSQVLAYLKKGEVPRVDRKDPTVVEETVDFISNNQCRLDTYLAGALCDKNFLDPVDLEDSERHFCNRSEGYTIGVRPLCWYRPSEV